MHIKNDVKLLYYSLRKTNSTILPSQVSKILTQKCIHEVKSIINKYIFQYMNYISYLK